MADKNSEIELTETESRSLAIDSSQFAQLTGFQRDLLIIVAGMSTPKGLEIKEELEKYYEQNINHGRLYPNLDTLAEQQLIEKISIDDRSNGYMLTDLGRDQLNAREQWEHEYKSNIDSSELISTHGEQTDTEHGVVDSPSSDTGTTQDENTASTPETSQASGGKTGESGIMGEIETEVDESDRSGDDT